MCHLLKHPGNPSFLLTYWKRRGLKSRRIYSPACHAMIQKEYSGVESKQNPGVYGFG